MKELKKYINESVFDINESVFDIDDEIDITVGKEIGRKFVVGYLDEYSVLLDRINKSSWSPITLNQDIIDDMAYAVRNVQARIFSFYGRINLDVSKGELDLRGLKIDIGRNVCEVKRGRSSKPYVIKNGSLDVGTLILNDSSDQSRFSDLKIDADSNIICNGVFPKLDSKSLIDTYFIQINIAKGSTPDDDYWTPENMDDKEVFKELTKKTGINSPKIKYGVANFNLPREARKFDKNGKVRN